MQIAWYSPTHDKIVVQDCSVYSEKIITYDPVSVLGMSTAGVVDLALSGINAQLSYSMFYGENFHWLEQGLWVRLGEV